MALLVFLFLLVSCQPPKPQEEIFWPAPPKKPRIQYVETLYGNRNLKRSFWGKIRDFLFGKSTNHFIGKPYGTVFNGKSKLFIADTAKKGVLVLDFASGKTKFFNSLGSYGTLGEPVYIVLDKNGHIYVSDTKLKKIAVFSPDYKFSHFIGSDGDFEGPVGMTFSKNEEKLFIVDSQDHKVKIYSKDGQFIKAFGGRGDEKGEFYFPLTVAINQGDSVYIVDSFHFSVQVFDTDGNFLFNFGASQKKIGTLHRPRDKAIDSDNNIYITDALKNNVQIFDNAGRLLLKFGQSGINSGEFRLPAGISIDDENNIYIADSINERIQVFKYLSQSE
jgi:DNA-binding beta-propeller fold protein YncE